MNTSGDLVLTNNDITSSTSVATGIATTSGVSANVTSDTSSVTTDISSDDSSDISSVSTPDMMGTVANGGMTVMTTADLANPNRMNIENICDGTSFNGQCVPANADDNLAPAIPDTIVNPSITAPTPSASMPNVSGVEAEMEDINGGVVAEEEWSPTEALQKIQQGGQIKMGDFQSLTMELLEKKCWSSQDVKEFLEIVQRLSDLGKDAKTFDESIQIMMTTEYRDMMMDLMKKVDTMNVVCAYNGRCNMIQDPNARREMLKFVNMVNQMVDMYLPVLGAIAAQFDKMIENSSEACQLDPAYSRLLIDTRNKIFDTLVTRKDRSLEQNGMNEPTMPVVTSDMSTDVSTDMSGDMSTDVSTDMSTDMMDSSEIPEPTVMPVPVPVPVPVTGPVLPPINVTDSPYGTTGPTNGQSDSNNVQPATNGAQPNSYQQGQNMASYVSSYFDNDNLTFTLFLIFLIVLIIVAVVYLSGCVSSDEK